MLFDSQDIYSKRMRNSSINDRYQNLMKINEQQEEEEEKNKWLSNTPTNKSVMFMLKCKQICI